METNHPFSPDNELYDMLVETRQAMTYGQSDEEFGMPDIDEEWQALSAKTARQSHRPALLRSAAAVVGLIMMAGIAFAAIHLIQRQRQSAVTPPQTVQKPIVKTRKNDSTARPFVVKPTPNAPVVFEDVTLERILATVAQTYDCRVEYRHGEARRVRLYLQWDADDSLESFIEKVNHFEKVHLNYQSESKLITVE